MQSIFFPQRQRYDYEQESTNSFLGADARTTWKKGNIFMGHLESSFPMVSGEKKRDS